MISKLADGDIRLIDSGQVITDVRSIVKELLENALDAEATSIALTLDGHGLDQITVQDNGTGIPEVDRSSIALFAHTSKLNSFSELSSVRTYGFRGQALASLAEISQGFSIVTRTVNDLVAKTYEFSTGRELKCVKTSADPKGTTITVRKPWFRVPVRRGKFKKEVSKIVSRLSHMLDVYAFAKPDIRFQLNFKARKKGDGFSTIIRLSQRSLRDCVASVHGTALVNTYTQVNHEHGGFMISGLLPGQTTMKSTTGPAYHIFFDSRPISCNRGTPKTILFLLRQHIQHFCPAVGSSPFFVLHIDCPLSTYDPNVEPAKDNLFFEDEQRVIEAVQSMLQKTYGNMELDTSRTLDGHQKIVRRACHTVANICQPMQSKQNHPESCLNRMPIPAAQQACFSNTDPSTIDNTDSPFMRGSPLRCHETSSLIVARDTAESSSSLDTPQPGEVTPSGIEAGDVITWKFSMFDSGEDELLDRSGDSRLDSSSMQFTGADLEDIDNDYIPNRPILHNPWSLARLHGKRMSQKQEQKTALAAQHAHNHNTSTHKNATEQTKQHSIATHANRTQPLINEFAALSSRKRPKLYHRQFHSPNMTANTTCIPKNRETTIGGSLAQTATAVNTKSGTAKQFSVSHSALEQTSIQDQVHGLSRELETNSIICDIQTMDYHSITYDNFVPIKTSRKELGSIKTTRFLQNLSRQLSLWTLQHEHGSSLYVIPQNDGERIDHEYILSVMQGSEDPARMIRLW